MIALIPARGGSKGIPRKNLCIVGGMSLLERAVLCGQRATSVSRVIVSTDDKEIAEAAVRAGAEVPFMRSPELAGDSSRGIDVILDAAQRLSASGPEPVRELVILQPTSPFRTPGDVDRAIDLYRRQRTPLAVVAVTELEHPIEWVRALGNDCVLQPIPSVSDPGIHNRQESAIKVVIPNGAIYVVDTPRLESTRSLLSGSVGYLMPRERSIDIDDPVDLLIAEALVPEWDWTKQGSESRRR